MKSPFKNQSIARKEERSDELQALLKKKFEDTKAMTDRKIQAKDLMYTTPFIRSGFIDKKKLSPETHSVFEVLGLDRVLNKF